MTITIYDWETGDQEIIQVSADEILTQAFDLAKNIFYTTGKNVMIKHTKEGVLIAKDSRGFQQR